MKILVLIGTVFTLTVGTVLFMINKNRLIDTSNSTTENSSSISPTSFSSSISSVPLSQESDIIRAFFNFIEERRISDAVGMMSDVVTKDESTKQAWGVQLNAMKSVKVLSVDKSIPEEWSSTNHSYKVVLDMVMDSTSATAPIPYYGYENGTNIRWVVLQKSGDMWKIAGITTGP